ncbi:hypothetical protein KIN20_012355 [Parelaphostrongylus tenuis]|uniref:Uncharacterized protein n=1 Tax=Parelaphostrongylus tenuis TaxID=148309 RepID=A0AAD5MC15_PARTN|nr:hypothetical protein KIN20_012355 [Parelaphostrongylus tenuis]
MKPSQEVIGNLLLYEFQLGHNFQTAIDNIKTSIVQKAAKLWVELRCMNGLQTFAMEILLWPINQDPEDRVKLIEKQLLKRWKKIRLSRLVIWPMILNVASRSDPATLSDIVSNWTVAIRQFHATAIAKSFYFKTRQSHTLPKNKEVVDRFELEALGSSVVFAGSVSVWFPSLQIIEHWLDKKKFRDINHLCRELTGWFASRNSEFYERE